MPLVAITLVLGACGSSAAEGPATYAQVHPAGAPGAVDVWRDSKGRLTFHWHGDRSGEIERYDPKTIELAEFSDGAALSSETFSCSDEAWVRLHAWYGVTKRDVSSALASGSPSPEPVDFRVSTGKTGDISYEVGGGAGCSTDYGTDVGRLARATGLVVPDLRTLAGYPLIGAVMRPDGAGVLSFGPDPKRAAIEVNIARYEPGKPNAPGTIYRNFFNTQPRHHIAGIPYADVFGDGVNFKYHGDWIAVYSVRVDLSKQWPAIIREIVAAPTIG